MQLRPYQQEAVDKALAIMRNGGGFGLWLEQRTGKTRTALTIAAAVRPSHLWIICPKAGGAAPVVWWREIDKLRTTHPQLDDIEIRVENYEQTVIHKKKRYDEARELKKLMVICDESHFIKARGTARSRTVRHVGTFAKWRLALTGTPIAQGIQDAWAQFDFIDPAIFGKYDDEVERDPKTGKILRVLEEGFDSRHIRWGGYDKKEIIGYRNEKEFYSKFHAHSYRKTLREAREKPLLLRYSKAPIELTNASRRVYDQLKHELVAEVNKTKLKVKNILACLVKLQQVTGGSVLVPEPHPPTCWCETCGGDGTPPPAKYTVEDISHEKLDKLDQLVRSFRARSKFIVVARFRHEIDRIAKALRKRALNVQIVRGGEPYNGKFNCDCLVMQIQSGIAVDMSQADTIVFYSIDFSMLNFEQARFRILNFDKPLGHYHFILATNTVDEQIYEAVTRKKNVAKLICDTYRTNRS